MLQLCRLLVLILSTMNRSFRAAFWWGACLPKICHTYSTMIKLGLYLTYRRPKKCTNHVTKALNSADSSISSPEISNFGYIGKYRSEFFGNTVFAELRINRPKPCGTCVFQQSFHFRKLVEITLFDAVFCTW